MRSASFLRTCLYVLYLLNMSRYVFSRKCSSWCGQSHQNTRKRVSMRAFSSNVFDCEVAKKYIEEYRVRSNAFKCGCLPINLTRFLIISWYAKMVWWTEHISTSFDPNRFYSYIFCINQTSNGHEKFLKIKKYFQ